LRGGGSSCLSVLRPQGRRKEIQPEGHPATTEKVQRFNFYMKTKIKRGRRKKTTIKAQNSSRKVSNREHISDLELLEMLIKKIIEKLEKNSCEAKVQDALKAIQLRQKLTLNSNTSLSSRKNRICEAEKMFWEMIDEIRKEELSKLSLQLKEDMVKSKKS
jgi:hypothetical protein